MKLLIIFFLSLIATPFIKMLASKWRIVDVADGDSLKIHARSTALLGGVVLIVVMSVGILLLAPGAVLKTLSFYVFFAGGLLVFCTGLWDDIRKVNPNVRICVHLAAGILVFLAGSKVNVVPLLWITVPLTVFYIAGSINAFNVIDGMDGLCAGLSMISCAGFLFIGIKDHNTILIVLSSVLCVTLLGFLPYNFYPAKIFLGDAGSGLLGYLLGLMAVMATSKPYDLKSLIIPILIIGVPVIDMTAAIVRRAIRKKPLFTGDRDHSYDYFLKRGMSQRVVWFLFCGVQACIVLFAILLYG